MKNKQLHTTIHYLLYTFTFLLVLNFTFLLGVMGTEFSNTEMCNNIALSFMICIIFMATLAGVLATIAYIKDK